MKYPELQGGLSGRIHQIGHVFTFKVGSRFGFVDGKKRCSLK